MLAAEVLRPNSMRVVAERLLEMRAVAESALDVDGLVGRVTRIDVGLLRPQQSLRRIWIRAQDRLTTHNYEFAFPDYLSGGGDNVLEILTAHLLSDLFEDLPTLSFREHAGKRRVLP